MFYLFVVVVVVVVIVVVIGGGGGFSSLFWGFNLVSVTAELFPLSAEFDVK